MKYSSSFLVQLSDTDMTGVIYFTNLFKWASQTFERFLFEENILATANFLLPIVHASGDYLEPLQIGDQIKCDLYLESIGTTSFKLQMNLYKHPETLAGVVSIVHVAVDQKKGEKILLPDALLPSLNKIKE